MNIYSVTILITGLVFGLIQPTVSSVIVSSSTPLSTRISSTTTSSSTPWSTRTVTTATTSSSAITSTYSNSLQSSSPRFVRPNGTEGNFYYYQAIQVTTYTFATYTFTSHSLMDTYGCFYELSFDPSNPSRNLVICDDDSGGNLQFRISRTLQSGRTYVLVVTTFHGGDAGSYSITAVGPATVSMTSITPSTYPTTVTTSTSAPSVTTNYSNSLQSSSPRFVRPSGNTGSYYYYQAIQVTTYTTGTYAFTSSSSMDTYGCFYQGSFDPSNPSRNLIVCDDDSAGDGQFLISRGLIYGETYILVVTTYSGGVTGSYSIIAVGPATISMTSITPSTYSTTVTTSTSAPSVTTNYSNSLQSSSPRFVRPSGNAGSYYYYQAIQVTTYTTGTYAFRSSSSIDTYGCFYQGSFDPSNPLRNLIICDDDSAGDRQFLISRVLFYGETYILVVTTYSGGVTGIYSITAVGPTTVSMTSITPSTYPTTVTRPTSAPSVTTTYSNSLQSSSPSFFRPSGNTGSYYYYQAIQVTTYTTGTYAFTSSSSMDTYGCFYQGSFDPYSPARNLIICDDDSAGDGQFLISRGLIYGETYILVVTTYSGGVTGSYSIIAVGPATVYMTSITPTTPTFSGTLSLSSPKFSRPYGAGSNYYYQAIQTKTYTAGTYTLRSSGLMNTYGCLYDGSFDPSRPLRNLIAYDDDSGGNLQFLISRYLLSERTYILVVTTSSSSTTGSYSVTATGPGSMTMSAITPPSYNPLNTLQIVAITFGCLIAFVIILTICTCWRKRQTASNQRLISPRYNSNPRAQNVYLPGAQRNGAQRNVAGMSYTPPPYIAPVAVTENLPPSYETFMSTVKPYEQ